MIALSPSLLPPATASDTGPLVILTGTGTSRDGLPVLSLHPSPEPYLEVLKRGFSGRLLRLYPLVQRMADPLRTPEPAYLLLSDHQGGFPRFGFHLGDERRPSTAYVDLHRGSTLSGRPGAMDQIFPHELLHIFVHYLAGEPPSGGANQVHAIGVRTDRITAFNEGFAEHGQLMAIDAGDAVAGTQALARDTELTERAAARLAEYRRALTAPWSIAPRARMTFPLWFSGTEQVLRYHGVRANLFAREVAAAEPFDSGMALFETYLLDSVLPGEPDAPMRPPARALALEGVVSAFFYRLVTSLAAGSRSAPFDGEAGRPGAALLDATDEAYTKIFAAIREGGYDTARVVDACRRLFPRDAELIDRVAAETFGVVPLPASSEIWLWNEAFETGTTVFDQFRALPRAHTFDLNAASRVDLAGVPGMTKETAARVLDALPVMSVGDLSRHGVDVRVVETLDRMRAAFNRHRAADIEDEASLSISTILTPYLWRALWALVGGAVVSSLLYRLVRRARSWRVLVNGLAAAGLGLVVGWSVDPGSGLLAFAVPAAVFGGPAAAWQLLRHGSRAGAARSLAAWACAAIVPALLVRPIG